MSTFGEITEPSSRALWGNYDSDDEAEEAVLSWEHQECIIPSEVELLLIAEGTSAVEFVERCIVTDQPINKICGVDVSIYTSADTIVCTSLNEDDNRSGEIALLLKPWIMAAKKVVAVKSLSSTCYRSPCNLESAYLLRSLKTKNAEDDNPIPTLEQPNILNGLSAGVLSLSEFLDRPASVYAFYMDYPVLGMDSTDVQPLTQLFTDLKIPCSKPFVTKIKIPSNLYL